MAKQDNVPNFLNDMQSIFDIIVNDPLARESSNKIEDILAWYEDHTELTDMKSNHKEKCKRNIHVLIKHYETILKYLYDLK